MSTPSRWLPTLPILEWGRSYNRENLTNDLVAALIVTIMLIPQSLAYALLAGLPPEVGLYASVAPLLLYAVLGSSRVLAVGPVAVISLMTAAAVGEHSQWDPCVLANRHHFGFFIWRHAFAHGFAAAGVSGQFSESPRHLRFHFDFWLADCTEPNEDAHGRQSRRPQLY